MYVRLNPLPHVYHALFESRYQLAMHFLRAQEYYESPKYRGEIFTLVDYMEWYAENQGEGAFTYMKDWSGFNVPSWVLEDVYSKRWVEIDDFNKYDFDMFNLFSRLREDEKGHPFYLIGTSEEDKHSQATLDHEMAHGLYFTDPEYKAGADRIVQESRPGEREAIHKILKDMGYAEAVWDDEFQAYCSTGLIASMKGKVSLSTRRKFMAFFKKIRDDRKKRMK